MSGRAERPGADRTVWQESGGGPGPTEAVAALPVRVAGAHGHSGQYSGRHTGRAGTAAVGGPQLLSHDTTTDGQLTPSLSRFVVHCSLLSTAGHFSGRLQHGRGPVAVLRQLAEPPCSVCDNTGRAVHNTSPALHRRWHNFRLRQTIYLDSTSVGGGIRSPVANHELHVHGVQNWDGRGREGSAEVAWRNRRAL